MSAVYSAAVFSADHRSRRHVDCYHISRKGKKNSYQQSSLSTYSLFIEVQVSSSVAQPNSSLLWECCITLY